MAKQHKTRVGYGPHDWDCEPCREQDAIRRGERQNPHRAGTKVAAEWERMNNAGLQACDPRTETYWSM